MLEKVLMKRERKNVVRDLRETGERRIATIGLFRKAVVDGKKTIVLEPDPEFIRDVYQ